LNDEDLERAQRRNRRTLRIIVVFMVAAVIFASYRLYATSGSGIIGGPGMVAGWSIGPPVSVSSDVRCDFAGVAQRAFHRAHPGENGSGMQLYAEGSYVASNGRLVSLPHTGRRFVAVFTLGNGRRVALGVHCELGPAGVSSSPPDQSLIDQWADTPLAEGI
jgi:hypothetical protein